jgi:hypothetical protein
LPCYFAVLLCRSNPKKVFSADIGVELSYQVLDILEYACGLILVLVLISNENPNFEITSSNNNNAMKNGEVMTHVC